MHFAEWLRLTHVVCAAFSGLGFALRGYWMWRNDARLRAPWVRRLPHVVDTVLLLSGAGLAYLYRFSPTEQPWLAAKLIALAIYIVLGMVALRRGRTRRVRALALVAALAVFALIVATALAKRVPFLA